MTVSEESWAGEKLGVHPLERKSEAALCFLSSEACLNNTNKMLRPLPEELGRVTGRLAKVRNICEEKPNFRVSLGLGNTLGGGAVPGSHWALTT